MYAEAGEFTEKLERNAMKMSGSPKIMMRSGMHDALIRQVKWLFIMFAGLAAVLVLFSARSPSGQKWLQTSGQQKSSTTRDAEKNWNTWTTRATEWEIRNAVPQEQGEDPNWEGRQRMRKERANGAFWWDERAEQYFISKLEASQFPVNCSEAHWIAHYHFVAGLMSSVHMFLLPLLFSMLRGHTLVVTSDETGHPAFAGCGPNLSDRNMQCYFNVTNCNPPQDPSRLSQIMAIQEDDQRTTWEEVLMEEDDFFPQGGVTVMQTFKRPPWDTKVCVDTSSFTSFGEAYNYHKFSVWNTMGRHGKIGVVTGNRTGKKCPDLGSVNSSTTEVLHDEDPKKSKRADMVMTALMSSWMLNRVHDNVQRVADQIMSRYMDPSGKPLWQPPVLAIHVRQTDKLTEDPYFIENGVYRPIENYAVHMRQIEEQYGFQWPSVFIISDSGSARETLVGAMNSTTGNSTSRGYDKKYIMYDWIEDDRLQEKFQDHIHVPETLKHDMQVHFLAGLYIVQKIADHAIVTYSSNVGRFIGEVLAAKNRMALVAPEGPLVTSLDYRWFWLE